MISVAAGVPGLLVGSGGGDDRIVPAEGAKVQADGGGGADTLDFSSWTSPVTTEAPIAGHFQADLTAAQEVTPSASTATGDVFLSLNLTTGLVEFLFADVSGITPAQEAGSHIQLGAPGVQDSILYDLETGPEPDATWGANGGGMILFSSNGIFPASRIADVVAGNTFVNIRSTNARCGPAGNQACADGEIRGQILSTDIGYTASATSGLFNGLENLTGGGAADSLVGNPLANAIDGGPGADTIRAAEGDDNVTGGPGADDLGGGIGDDRLVAADGEADTAINCGPGTDVADRDLAGAGRRCDPRRMRGGEHSGATAGDDLANRREREAQRQAAPRDQHRCDGRLSPVRVG